MNHASLVIALSNYKLYVEEGGEPSASATYKDSTKQEVDSLPKHLPHRNHESRLRETFPKLDLSRQTRKFRTMITSQAIYSTDPKTGPGQKESPRPLGNARPHLQTSRVKELCQSPLARQKLSGSEFSQKWTNSNDLSEGPLSDRGSHPTLENFQKELQQTK
ncbi:hypothetical protein F2Q68_00024729 [Brassica cretica]|uniref:Uncharacterized protein n=1 Tax=Brassica cretica TaxID=69181 RepID=A0A8S9IJJ3_BRACR|nr:hypothetical protein F2Q68_00024729 [Brassica cretica]